jgi:lipopolysaccharide cholinephosphotransferase
LQTYYSDKSYFRNYAKIRNSNTTFVEESVKYLKMNHGIYIDVFPIDYYPNKRYERAILEVKKMFYTARVSQEYYIKNENKFRRFVRCFLAKFSRSADEAVKKRDLVIKGSKETKFIINHDGNWGKKEIMPAEWFAKSMKLTFEGIEVNAPVEFDKILTHLYGNYMVYPPKDKQVSHHETVLIDVEKSYKYYTDSLVVK